MWKIRTTRSIYNLIYAAQNHHSEASRYWRFNENVICGFKKKKKKKEAVYTSILFFFLLH